MNVPGGLFYAQGILVDQLIRMRFGEYFSQTELERRSQ